MRKILIIIFISVFSIGAVGKINGQVKDAEVYVVFFSVSPDLTSEILSNLKEKCEGIKFSGNKIISYDGKEGYETNESVLLDIEILKGNRNLDGLILFCGSFCDGRFLQTELPTLIVDCSPFRGEKISTHSRFPSLRGQQMGFKNAEALAEKFETKFITAYYPTYETKSIAELKINDFTEKVNLFKVIKDLKNSKIISIQDHKGINRIDQGTDYGYSLNPLITNYDITYPSKLKEYLGIELIFVNCEEMSQQIEKIDINEAEKIADMWINEATEVKNVQKHDIVSAAKFYLANKALLKKYDADAITYESAGLSGKLQQVYPLVIMELSKENIPATCQSHIDCVVTQLIGHYMKVGEGFTGDFINDWIFEPTGDRPKNVMIIGHCGAPISVYGHERIPYLITSHYISLHIERFKEGNTPPAITVDWPTDEVASICKVDLYRKKMSVVTGTVLDGNSLYKHFPNVSCRNKIVIKLDRPEDCYMLPSDPNVGGFIQNRAWDDEYRLFGIHDVVFYGKLRQRVRNLGSLLGFDVISN